MARCIELNPVRANMCNHSSDYRWASVNFNAEGKMWFTDLERQGAYLLLFKHAL
jgi:hypothetical protein